MVVFKNCSFKYNNKNLILENFSFRFANEGMYALVGKSGSGKTTILNLIAGIIKPTDGSILYSDKIKNISESISYIFQNDNLFSNLTVLENVNILVKITQKKVENKEIDDVLNKLGILMLKNKKVSDISGGERQRVSIAIALLKKSKVILADEPCASLDCETSKEIMDIFHELSKEKLIIISSHNLDLVKEYCLNIIEFPLKDNYQFEEDLTTFYKAKKEGKNLSFSNIFKTYFKVFGHKIYLGLLAFIMFTIVISLSIFSFSIIKIDEEKVMINKIKYDNISDVFVSGDTQMLSNDLTQNGLKYINDNLNVYNFGGTDKEASNYYDINVVKKIILDDSLDDYTIQMTDYSLYALRFYDAIDFDQPTDMLGKELKIKVYGKNLLFRIDNIIETKAGELIKNKESFTYLMDSSKFSGVYSFLKINTKTYFEIYELSPSNPFYNIEYVDGIKCDTVEYDDSLHNNEIIITKSLLNNIELSQHKKYSIGDEITLMLTSMKNTSVCESFIIKSIVDSIYNVLSVSNDINTPDFRYELSYVKNTTDYYFETNKINVEKLIHSIYMHNSLSISFHEDSVVSYFSQDLSYFNKIALVSTIVTSLLLFALLSYSSISIFNLNKKYYQLLYLYGMKKSNSFVFMTLDILPSLMISLIIGNVIGKKLCSMFDEMILPKTSLNIINSFNFNLSMVVTIIIFICTIFIVCVLYTILILKKNRSYIGL